MFWVADAGPLEYGKQFAGELFEATGMLIPGGILVAGIFAVGSKFVARSIANSSVAVDGSFATGGGIAPIVKAALPGFAAGAMCLLGVMTIYSQISGGLGGAAGAASAAKSAGSKLKGGASTLGSKVGGGRRWRWRNRRWESIPRCWGGPAAGRRRPGWHDERG